MSISKEPLIFPCFKCQKSLLVKFVLPQKRHSQKNNWGYWTEKEENKDKYICNKCLKKLYKKKRYFWEQVRNLAKRQRLCVYIYENKLT